MALPPINPETKEFQKESLENQSQISKKIDSGISMLNHELKTQTKVLGKIENWLDQTYELHLENYQSLDEERREARRRKSGAGTATVGSSSLGVGGIPGIGKMLENIGDIGKYLLYGYGAKKAVDVAKTITKTNENKVKLEEKKAKLEEEKVKAEEKKVKAEEKKTKIQLNEKTSARPKPGDIIEKNGKKFIAGVDGKATAIEATKATQKDIDKIIKASENIDKKNIEKQAEAVEKVTKKSKFGGKLFDNISTVATKVFNASVVAEAVLVNVKDAYDIAVDYLDEDIRTELQKRDKYAVALGSVGGVLGAIGGPAGIVFGMSVGNYLGEVIGEKLDDDFTDNFIKASSDLDVQYDSVKKKLYDLQLARNEGMIKEEEFLKEKLKLEQDTKFYESMDAQRNIIKDLYDARDKAGQEYNELAKSIRADELAFKPISKERRQALIDAEKAFWERDKEFDIAAKEFSKEVDPYVALQSARLKGIYEKNWTGKSIIDLTRASELTVGELRAIIGDEDLSVDDTRSIRRILANKIGTESGVENAADIFQKTFNRALRTQDGKTLNEIISNVEAIGGKEAVDALLEGTLTNKMLGIGEAPAPTKPDTARKRYNDANLKPMSYRRASSISPVIDASRTRANKIYSMKAIPTSFAGINYKSYAMNLGERESSSNYGVIGGSGNAYLGKYQMGSIALEDIGLLKPGTGRNPYAWKNPNNWVGNLDSEKFLNTPDIQEAAMLEYTKKNYGYLKSYKFINDSSTPSEVAGYLAATHLIGIGNLIEQGLSGTDANSIKAAEYYGIGSRSQSRSSIFPSSRSPSGGNNGFNLNLNSKRNSAMGSGVSGIVVNNNNIDNSSRSSTTNNTSLQAVPNRNKTIGVSPDYRLDPVYGGGH